MAAWWRRVTGVLAALVLAVMLSAPALAAATCADQSVTAAVSIDQTDDAHADADQFDTGPCEDGCGPCVHCHCSHAGGYAPAAVTAASSPPTSAERHAMAQAPAPTSVLVFGLKRPPRG